MLIVSKRIKMRKILLVFLIGCLISDTLARAVSKKVESEDHKEESEENEDEVEANLEYERYLKEVVSALESDPEFRKKLDNATETDVRSGKIAHELEYVNHHVRTKLDEIKRREIERLRQLAMKEFEMRNNIDREHMKISEHEHIDHENHHTFEIEDLKKLIAKTSKDLEEADRKRREEFKQYELEKEFQKQEKLREMDEDHRKKYEEELKKQQELHDKHEKVHSPGHEAQLEEVWEKQDHMDKNDFNPDLFYRAHDYDRNGMLDETELKSILIRDVDKVFQPGHQEDDMREREEELERMKEQVLKEYDLNNDRMVSYDEFIAQTKREEFKKDPDWETVDHQPQFTHEEYLEFERRRQEQIQQMIARGEIPPHPYYQNNPQAGYAGHPNQIPPGGQPMHYQDQQQYANQQHQQQVYQHQQQQQQQYHQNQQQFQAPPQQQPQYQQQPQQQYNPQQQMNVQQQPPVVQQYQQQKHQSQPQPPANQVPIQQNLNHAPNPNIQVNNIPKQNPSPAVNIPPSNVPNNPSQNINVQGLSPKTANDNKQNAPNVISVDGKH